MSTRAKMSRQPCLHLCVPSSVRLRSSVMPLTLATHHTQRVTH